MGTALNVTRFVVREADVLYSCPLFSGRHQKRDLRVRFPFMETVEHLTQVLAAHYSLGDLVWAERNERGYINLSFDIATLQDGKRTAYLFRRYRVGAHENKIRFEHALMEELVTRRFHLSPSLVSTKYGTTYAKVRGDLEAGNQEYFVAVFDYLPGEDKYRWDDPLCTIDELTNAAEVFALYHNTIFGWKGISDWEEPRIIDQVAWLEAKWINYAKTAGNSLFDSYFLEQLDQLVQAAKNPTNFPSKTLYDTLPHLAIHGDYHPGNLKFREGRVSGLFDFDWAKMDTRCFDVALATTYFCSAWHDVRDGEILLDRVEIFLHSYQKAAEEMKPLGPLSAHELQVFPQLLLASTLHIVDWALGDYFMFTPDPEEYLRYLRHGVRLLKWLESNWTSLTNLVLK